MFVETFKIKTNSWHVKLVKFMWDLDYYEFSHICPYFWLVVGSILILPIYLVIRGIGEIIKAYRKWIFKMEEEDFQQYLSKLKNKKEYSNFYNFSDAKWRRFKRYINDLEGWEKYDDVINKIQSKRRSMEVEKIIEAEQKKERNSMLQKQRINKILKWIKPLSVTLIWVGSFAMLVGIVLFFKHIYQSYSFSLENFYNILKALGFIIFLTVAMFIVYYLIKSIFPAPKFNNIGKPFRWFFGGIGFIFTIIVQMIKNHCPSIDWEEK